MANRNTRTAREDIANIGKAVAVTVAAEADLGVTDGLYIGTTGNLVVTMADGNDRTFSNVAVGYHPLRIQKVRDTTTADDILALYA
jgi:hypothetical protein